MTDRHPVPISNTQSGSGVECGSSRNQKRLLTGDLDHGGAGWYNAMVSTYKVNS